MNINCELCKKVYASYKTLWYHKKSKHNIFISNHTVNIKNDDNDDIIDNLNDTNSEDNIVITNKINDVNVDNKITDVNVDNKINVINVDNIDTNIDICKTIEYSCEYCLKKYKTRQSKSRHKKTCSVKKTGATNVKEINDLINDLQNKIKDLEQNTGTKNIININNGTINNQTNNKIIINKIGDENPFELKINQIQKVLSQEILSIITLIEYLNFNEQLPSNHNFLTSSLESNYLTIYNSDDNTFEKQRKKYVFDEIMGSSINKIEKLYSVFKNDFPLERQYELKNNIDALKQIHQTGYNNKLLKELNKQLNLLSYNKKHIVEKTWSRLRNELVDEEDDKKYWLEIAEESKKDVNILVNKKDDNILVNKKQQIIEDDTRDVPHFKFFNNDGDSDTD